MSITSDQTFLKETIAPLDAIDWRDLPAEPISVLKGITIEDVEGRLRPEHFELWRDYLSKNSLPF